MLRIRLVFVLLAVLLALPTSLLVSRALRSVEEEQDARRRTLAERVFDEMERELSALVEREEARPVGHYRFSYTPEGAPAGTRVRSPLADGPREPWVLAWFQIEVDGAISSPHRPGAADPPATRTDWQADPGRERAVVQAEEVVRRLRGDLTREAPPQAQEPGTTVAVDEMRFEQLRALGYVVAGKAEADRDAVFSEADAQTASPERATPESRSPDLYDALQSLNRGVDQRAARQRKYELVEEAPADFAVADPALLPRASGAAAEGAASGITADAVVAGRGARQFEAEAPAPPKGLAKKDSASREMRAPAEAKVLASELEPPAAPRAVSEALAPHPRRDNRPAAAAAVDPLLGRRVDAEHLVLLRTVWIGERALRQGLVVSVPELEGSLRSRALGVRGLARAVLDFASATPPGDRPLPGEDSGRRYRHRFGDPFQSLAATLVLPQLASGGGAGTLYLLSGLLFAVGAAGFFALYRMVAVTVAFAERRSRFVAAVSHELKTPLTAIRMYGEMLRDGIVSEEGKRHEYYATITAESERLSRLINNVLEFSRLEKDQREMNLVSADIGAVVEEAATVVRPHAESQGFELQVEVEPGLPAVRFDRDALLQVLFNLVDNAVKYAGEATDRRIRIACRHAAGAAVLEVRDHGPGVPAEHLRRIFEPFYRGQDELTRTARGTGLGLALVKGLAERMGAAIQGRNRRDGGFEVCLRFRASA